MNTSEQKTSLEIKNIGRGTLISLLLLLIGSILIGVIVSIIDFDDYLVEQALSLFNYLVILIGSFFTGANVSQKGWLNGALVGLVHMLVIFLLALLLLGTAVTLGAFIMLLIGIVTGLLGGMVGININN
ncbi:TIGR04086 family membrane protein [Fuchsiella alkaliacetigena]|uniref:TIGR04086 family membrane protein n=1 Tax=Fuchsiella alkaliacetigena TaxID=957042 RepID=UPI00200AA7AA|nr:TIGR04086 family membrane protein [Fuchsiella alkaliacetigena]MCK8823470.1 TIGR04086 family membrane protein [Fuchsiella alkaliacetigena]